MLSFMRRLDEESDGFVGELLSIYSCRCPNNDTCFLLTYDRIMIVAHSD